MFSPRLRLALPFVLSLAAAGCAKSGRPAQAPAASSGHVAQAGPPNFIDDDIDGAIVRGRSENKAVFVDAWAPWCHTCLSMKHHVLNDPRLGRFSDKVVFAAIDTDREQNAAFLERHKVTVWPSFFLLDPAGGQIVGFWPGAASVDELASMVDDGLRIFEARRMQGQLTDDATQDLGVARGAHATGNYEMAAAVYARVLGRTPASWPRRSEALVGWIHSLYQAKDWAACVRLGRRYVMEVQGAAIPADFASYMLMCASNLPDAKSKAQAREAAIERLRRIVDAPPVGATADDRADALSILSDALKEDGDAAGARKAQQARLFILELAAQQARGPEEASTHDYARAGAYMALGRGPEAVKMLQEREKQLPNSYEPPARLADVLAKLGHHRQALAAADRAIALSYGPRRLRYLKLRSEILGELGDTRGQIATLKQEVAGWSELRRGHANMDKLADAEKRLAQAEQAPRKRQTSAAR